MEDQKSTAPSTPKLPVHPRNSHGQFIPKTPQTPLLTTTTTTDIDAPLVSVAINNPFKKILLWLDELRRKQTTEFDINTKLKIPLFAWIIMIGILFSIFFGSFNVFQYFQNAQLSTLLNKSTMHSITLIIPTPIPSPILLSRIGTIKAAYQINGIISTTSTPAVKVPTVSLPSITPARYILLTSIDQITFLSFAPDITVSPYLNKTVLVTGLYNAGKNTMQITRDEDIQLLP